MLSPEGIAFSVFVNTLVPDAYKMLKNILGVGFDQKLNRAYHRAVEAVLDAADHREISGMYQPATMGGKNYQSLNKFLWQKEFVISVSRTMSYGDPLRSDHLHSVYPSTLSQTLSLDILLDYFHPRLQDAFITEFGQDVTQRLPLFVATVRDDLVKAKEDIRDDIEELKGTVTEGFEFLRGKIERELNISYWLGRPATIGDGFVGRDAELEMIGKAFDHSRAVVISGGAGSGKSRLAAQYAHQSAMLGFWTAAGSAVVPTIAALAPALDIELGSRTDDEVAAEVGRVLASMPSDTF